LTCYHPLDCFFVVSGQTGKLAVRFSGDGEPGQVPCGQCIGCRLERSRQWAARCMHEASLQDDNCFITLTYDDEHLPSDGSLVKHHFQDFMKRLRRRFEPRRFRFFHCGEYGEQLHRPHYHALLFGLCFEDGELFSERDGARLFVSPLLNATWGKGFATFGEVTFESCAYVARYCVKKVNGEKAFFHYISPDGVMLEPEYCTMSRRPGIGREWYDEFSGDVFPSDEVIMRGKVLKPPRYYQKLYQIDDAEGYEALLAKRKEFFGKHQADCTPERLRQREVVKLAQVSFLKRSLVNEA